MSEKIVDIREMLDSIPEPKNNTREVYHKGRSKIKKSFDDYGR